MILELVKTLDGRSPDERLATGDGRCTVRVQRLTYRTAIGSPRLHAKAVIFADLGELIAPERTVLANFWKSATASNAPRLFNHPTRSMRRYELLRELHERGFNEFDVYSLLEARQPVRYPVYLTQAAGENELPVELLAEPADLVVEVGKLVTLALAREGRIVIEHRGTPDARGLYRRYVALGIGSAVIPWSMNISRHWRATRSDPELVAELRRERQDYVGGELKERAIADAFGVTRLDVGLIDYILVGNRPQILDIRPGLPPQIDSAGVPGDDFEAIARDRCVAALTTLADQARRA